MAMRRHELTRRRETLGISSTRLAQMLGISRSTAYRWEVGETDPLPEHRAPLARTLQVSMEDLDRLLRSDQAEPRASAVEESNTKTKSLANFGHGQGGKEDMERRQFLGGLVAAGLAAAVPSLAIDPGQSEANLDAVVGRAIRLEQRSQYVALSALLPGVIAEARRSISQTPSIADSGAARSLSMARTVEAFVLVKQDRPAEAQAAATDAVQIAQATADPVLVGTTLRCLAETHMRGATYEVAADLAIEGASHIGRHRATDAAAIAVQGAGLLTAATASARAGERGPAIELLEAAAICADELARDQIGALVFGPTNLAIHRVAVEVELGDPIEALRQADKFRLAPNAALSERQARYLLDVARAQAEVGQASEAVSTLLQAESIGPEEIRTHRHSKTVLSKLLAQPGGVSMELRPLANRCGVFTGQ